jgi:hypothetical protein
MVHSSRLANAITIHTFANLQGRQTDRHGCGAPMTKVNKFILLARD